MNSVRPYLRNAAISAAVLAMMTVAHWVGYRSGYQAGLSDKGPQHRALVVVRRTPGNPNSSGSQYTWFDVSKPGDAAKLAREEQRLKAAGADYYVAKGEIEKTLRPEPDPRRVNAHR